MATGGMGARPKRLKRLGTTDSRLTGAVIVIGLERFRCDKIAYTQHTAT